MHSPTLFRSFKHRTKQITSHRNCAHISHVSCTVWRHFFFSSATGSVRWSFQTITYQHSFFQTDPANIFNHIRVQAYSSDYSAWTDAGHMTIYNMGHNVHARHLLETKTFVHKHTTDQSLKPCPTPDRECFNLPAALHMRDLHAGVH